jgi:hypothetical protein
MFDGRSGSVALRIVSDAPRIATTRVVRAFGQRPSQILSDSIAKLLTGRVERLRAVTVDRRLAQRQSMIRLFRCRSLASPSPVSSGASSPTMERHALCGSISANALGPLGARAAGHAVPPTAVTGPTQREWRPASIALPEVALHLVWRVGLATFWTSIAETEILAASVTRALPCASCEPIEVSEL